MSGPLAETNKKNTVDLVSVERRLSSRPGPAPAPALQLLLPQTSPGPEGPDPVPPLPR